LTDVQFVKNVAPGARLDIEVKQEGDAHVVRGRLLHENSEVATWPSGELEERTTEVLLARSGMYQLLLYVAFFGAHPEEVTIRLSVSGSSLVIQHKVSGRAGDMRTFITAISVS
jgi:hypothetical protein